MQVMKVVRKATLDDLKPSWNPYRVGLSLLFLDLTVFISYGSSYVLVMKIVCMESQSRYFFLYSDFITYYLCV